MKRISFILIPAFILLLTNTVYSQQARPAAVNRFVDFSATAGSNEGAITASYVYNWRLGKKRKLEIGAGGRLTSYFGTKKEFYTALARLARSTTFPFVIVFAGHEEENIDTLTVQRPLTFFANVSINFGYNFTPRLYGGFNIDLAGITVGRKSSAVLLSNGETTTEPFAKPSVFNALLTGDNDLGSLNSEFFIKYRVGKRLSLKADYQFLFTEYKTTTVQQTAPDGTSVNRFRNKVNAFGVGVSYNL